MTKTLLSGLALTVALTSAAWARAADPTAPVMLSAAQLDTIAAGRSNVDTATPFGSKLGIGRDGMIVAGSKPGVGVGSGGTNKP